jgi:type II secretory pathway pseudopilin PulG
MKTQYGPAPDRGLRSFTLIEMLVSIAVLSLMIAAMAQMLELIGNAWVQGTSRTEDFTKGRSTLDLVIADIQRGVFRSDIPSFLSNAQSVSTNGASYFINGSFTNAFYTRTPGVSGVSVRDVSLISYALNSVNQGSDKISLQRAELPVPWGTSGASQISFGSDSTFMTLLSQTTPQELAPGVVGFQMLFRRQDGSVILCSSYTGEDFTHGPVIAIGVGIALVGKQALSQMSSTQVSNFASQIQAVPIATSAKSAWDAGIGPATLNQYPKNLAFSFMTFERWVACQPF